MMVIRRYEIPLLLLAVLAGSLMLTLATPVYFRQDDVGYLAWAAGAASPLEAFHPDTGTLFSMFRPTVNLWWMGLYSLFELHPAGYQFLLAALYGCALIFWWLALRKLESIAFAVTTVAAWILCFYYLQYVIFWFSAFVYVLQIFFLMVAFHGAVRWYRNERGAPLMQVGIAHVLAVLTKEPAALILSAIYGALILREIHASGVPAAHRLRGMCVLAAMGAAGIGWVLFKPGLGTRAGLAEALQNGTHLEFVAERWSFYSSFLTSGAGPLLWGACGILLLNAAHRCKSLARWLLYFAAGIVLAGMVVTQIHTGVALVLLFIGLGVLCVCDSKARLAAVWFVPPILCLHIINFQVRTYLIEASFGAALVMGYAFTPAPIRGWTWVRTVPLKIKLGATLMAMVFFVIAGSVVKGRVVSKWEALRTVSTVRTQFAGMIHHIRANEISPVVFLDYSDMGMHYGRDVLALSDLPKSRIQKPMESGEAKLLLRLAAPPEVVVLSWGDWESRGRPQAWILAMTSQEIDWLNNSGIPMETVHRLNSPLSPSTLFRTR